MSISSQKTPKKAKIKLILIALALFLIVPAFAFSSHEKNIYVDAGASGSQDGSKKHPYKTIDQAMDKADKNTKIHLANGKYKENVEMKDGVEMYGDEKSKTVIEARNDNKPAVLMKDHTKIGMLTVQEGRDGIRVNHDAEAEIWKCMIQENDDDGIHIEEGSLKQSAKVTISESEIKRNHNAGIYSERRNIVVVDNAIEANKSNGIDIERNAKAWISGNYIAGNKGVGMKMRVDGSSILTKSNNIRHNEKGGMEVNFSGQSGKIDVSKTEIFKNGGNGIIKIQKYRFADNINLWNKYFTYGDRNKIFGNVAPDISGIIYN
jgi:hypothetical protein